MGRFTVLDNPAIDDAIQKDLDIICEEILRVSSPLSILLKGSFGRGEGSVIIDGAAIQPLNDYDILIVVDEKLPRQLLNSAEKKIFDSLNRSRPETSRIAYASFHPTLDQTTPQDISSYANIGTYDIKTASRLLYGKDIRSDIHLTLGDIPVLTGLHYLFMKHVGLISRFPKDYEKNPPEGMTKTLMIYECGKAYVEMGTALCILGGVYRPKFAERNEILNEEQNRLFPDLVKRSPDLFRKIDYFTRLKLRPDPQVFSSADPVALWFETRQDLLDVTDYFLQTCCGISCTGDRVACSGTVYAHMKKYYFHAIFSYYLRVRFGLQCDPVTSVVNYLYQRYAAAEFYLQCRHDGKNTLRVIGESPILKIFTLAPLLLLAIRRDGGTDRQLLGYVRCELGKILYDPPAPGNDPDWDQARASLLRVFRTYGRIF